MKTIRLKNEKWTFDQNHRLGEEGGFGEVFNGHGERGEVAVKRLKLTAVQAAHRELSIASHLMKSSLKNVVEILDSGQDSESERYFIVMPKCEYNLEDALKNQEDQLNHISKFGIILNIIDGLLEVPEITHRDLKPANILFHDRTWKIADFGIAKFVEDSTSLETLRKCLTPMYAAPEQWKGDRPSSETDVYALGCIIHAVFTGNPPFSGTLDDVRESHLHDVPNKIAELPAKFSAFTSQMLRKSPQARPTLARCKKVFSDFKIEDCNSNNPIFQAAETVAQVESVKDAELRKIAEGKTLRNDLYKEAKQEMEIIRTSLFSKICDASDNAKIRSNENVLFGESELYFKESESLSHFDNSTGKSKLFTRSGWNVVAWSTISVVCKVRRYTWSASLLYADRGEGFRWYELSFWSLSNKNSRDEPFALPATGNDIDFALSNMMHTINIAYGPYTIDCEDEDSFTVRWLNLVAKAAVGTLYRPSTMPISGLNNK
jgi:serine/threonine protein kinase